MPHPCARTVARRRAFTLAEVLIVMGIIIVLAGLLIPATGKAREQARRAQCASNIRQICLAAIRHAQEDEGQFYFPNPENNNDVDDFQPMYPKYIKDLKVFVCPSTMNQVNKPSDLANNAVGKNGLVGHSYEIRNWANGGTRWPDGMMFTANTRKNMRQFKNSSTGGMIMDADDKNAGYPGSINNWPDEGDNHGAAGCNVGFMDGHVEFLPPGRALLHAFLDGYYDPGVPGAIYSQYGVVQSGNAFTYK